MLINCPELAQVVAVGLCLRNTFVVVAFFGAFFTAEPVAEAFLATGAFFTADAFLGAFGLVTFFFCTEASARQSTAIYK